MKTYLSLLLVGLCSLGTVWGQIKLQNYEYWFDDDYANKTTVAITPTTQVDTSLAIPTNSLSAGLHTFYIRFQDDSLKYSTHLTQDFYSFFITNEITEYEYWFDDDYGAKVSQSITPTANLQLSVPINITALVPGMHTFKIRFAQGGIWSTIKESYCYTFSPTNNITAYEYWFDDNYAAKVSQTVTPTTSLNLTTAINVDALIGGLHTFHIRFNQGGVWTNVKQSHFYRLGQSGTANNMITAYRYWFDNQTSNMTTVTLTSPSSNVFLNEGLSVANVDTGFHKVHVQIKDISGNWSSVFSKKFWCFGNPKLHSIIPNKGGNGGDVTVNIIGEGFIAGTLVRFTKVGYPDIVIPDSLINTSKYGTQMRVTVDLHTPAPLGFWNVVVEIPNDTVMVLYNAFEVQPLKESKLNVQIVGNNMIRVNQWQGYSLFYENIGNVDARGVPVYLAVSNGVDIKFISKNVSVDTVGNTTLVVDSLYQFLQVDSLFGQPFIGKVYSIIVSNTSPTMSGSIEFKIKRSISNLPFRLICWSDPPLYGSPMKPGWGACIDELVSFAVGFTPWGCPYGIIKSRLDPAINLALVNNPEEYGIPEFLTDYVPASTASIIDCLIPKSYKTLWNIATAGIVTTPTILNSCYPVFNSEVEAEKQIMTVNSYDPNNKISTSGRGLLNYVKDSIKMSYIINFENLSTATAPAQTVIIRDTMNTNVYDMNTFELGAISIADSVIRVPPGLKNYVTDINLHGAQSNLACHIVVNTNVNTGVVTWTFTSVDPFFYEAITDPLAGFLPPNVTSPQGEGSVSYSVKVKPNLPLNTNIDNKASIYFDTNAPIVTNNWHNTLDNVKPVSSVISANAIIPDSTYLVTWSGTDMGSGILSYNIYYSTNNGSYKIWKLNTTALADTFVGRKDSIYCFYSVAKDTAINREEKPATPDVCTTLMLPLPIEWLNISAYPVDNSYIRINWTTQKEMNTDYFEIERSLDGRIFDNKVGKVESQALNGNSDVPLSYKIEDKNVGLNTQYYYRVKSIDLDGKYSYSQTVKTSLFQGNSVVNSVYPNPTNGNVEVDITNIAPTNYLFRVYNGLGQEVYSKEVEASIGNKKVLLETKNLASGIYKLLITEQGKYLSTVKVVKW